MRLETVSLVTDPWGFRRERVWYSSRLVVLLSLGVLALGAMNYWLREQGTAWVEPPIYGEEHYDARLLQTVSLGFYPVAVDALWIKVLMDPSYFHVPRTQHAQAYFDLDTATSLDPIYWELYYYGANLLAAIRDDVYGARDLLEKANQYRKSGLLGLPEKVRQTIWREEWQIPLVLAYVYLYELGDFSKAEKAFKEAADLPRAPAYLQLLKKRLNTPGGIYEVGIRVTGFLIAQSKDERARAELTRKRENLSIGYYLFQINAEFKKWKGARVRQFLKTHSHDPWGGVLSLDDHGKIITSTPYQPVFGLD